MPEPGYKKRRQKWDEAEIVAKIREWVELYGEVPASTDWHPGDCTRSARISAARSQAWMQRAERFKAGEYPWPGTVVKTFGRWSDAIRAAGYAPRRESMPVLAPAPTPAAALRAIEGYVSEAKHARSAEARRELLAKIADSALAALQGEPA